MPVSLVEGVDLRGVDALAPPTISMNSIISAEVRGSHPHGPDRHLALQLLDADLEQTAGLLAREDIPLAAPAAADVDADAGRGHAPQVATDGGLVKGAVFGERGDADDERAGPAPDHPARSVPCANAQAFPDFRT